MNATDERVIDLSWKKVLLVILGAFAIAFPLGCWIFFLEAETIRAWRRLNSPDFVHGFGLVMATFAVYSGIYGIRMLFGDMRGLVFNSAGILDCSRGVSEGFISWAEIEGVAVLKQRADRILAIRLKEPKRFIERKSRLTRLHFSANNLVFGSPVAISTQLFKVSPSELFVLFCTIPKKVRHA